MPMKIKQKPKLSFLIVKIIAILLILFSVQILMLVFTSLYMHFFAGHPIPQNVHWTADLIFYFVISVSVITIAIGLFLKKKIARIFAVICLFIVSILNLKAEFFSFEFPQSFMRLFIWGLYFIGALYLLFNKKLKRIFVR